MRRLFLLFAAASMALPVSSPAPADPPGRWPAAQSIAFCQAQFPDVPLGQCLSYLISGDEGFLTHFCLYLQATGQLGDMTLSECVESFHQDD